MYSERSLGHWAAAGDPTAVSTLSQFVKDPKFGLDEFAAHALGCIGSAATPKLIEFATGKDQRLIKMALKGLAQSDDSAAIGTLLSLSKSPDPKVRDLAARALGRRNEPAIIARLVAMLEDKDSAVVIAACAALGQIKDQSTVALGEFDRALRGRIEEQLYPRSRGRCTGIYYWPAI